MKVKDLVEVLSKCDQDKDIVLLDYGDDFADETNEIIECYEVSNSYNSDTNNKVYIVREVD